MSEWRDIPSCRGYVASSDGQIARKLPSGTFRILTPYVKSKRDVRKRGNYYCVTMSIDGERKIGRVHRLVCEAFHGPQPSPTHHACHGEKGAECNAAGNLRWDTPEANQAEVPFHSGDDWYRARGLEPPTAFGELLRTGEEESNGQGV